LTTCKICVMDESDPLIGFNGDGVCSRCTSWEAQWAVHLNLVKEYPEPLLTEVKAAGKGKRYDAVIGLSGGADSSWVYHLAKSAGLRLYPIHFDNGYDLPVSVHNVRCLTDHWGDVLHTVEVKGPEFRALQLAFLKSGTTGLEIPTDHAIKAVTYQAAQIHDVPTILNGTNIATESHGTPAWTQGHADWIYIRGIAERFGVELRDFPHYTFIDKAGWMSRKRWLSLLDYTDYHRQTAIDEMSQLYGYGDYGFKHMESRITRFLHGYIIPRRFGWDTRRSRMSSMIRSGQLTREAALEMLRHPAYAAEEMELDKLILCRNLGITAEDFEDLMNLPLKHYSDYPNRLNDPLQRVLRLGWRALK
jgi:N-acetyl sugar amidotransferase